MEVRFLLKRSEGHLDALLTNYFSNAVSSIYASREDNAIAWLSFFSHLAGVKGARLEASSKDLMLKNPNYPYNKAIRDFGEARMYLRGLIADVYDKSEISSKELLLLYSYEKFKNLLDE